MGANGRHRNGNPDRRRCLFRRHPRANFQGLRSYSHRRPRDRFASGAARGCWAYVVRLFSGNWPADRKPCTRLRHGDDFDGYFRGGASFSRIFRTLSPPCFVAPNPPTIIDLSWPMLRAGNVRRALFTRLAQRADGIGTRPAITAMRTVTSSPVAVSSRAHSSPPSARKTPPKLP
jgi:hypothetical protein